MEVIASSFGRINYTVSGDTSVSGDTLLVKKIEDVIKHNNYDSIAIAGTEFIINLCYLRSGNPLNIKNQEVLETLVYPNPFERSIAIRWQNNETYKMRLFRVCPYYRESELESSIADFIDRLYLELVHNIKSLSLKVRYNLS